MIVLALAVCSLLFFCIGVHTGKAIVHDKIEDRADKRIATLANGKLYYHERVR